MTALVHVRRATSGDAERVAPLFDAYRQFYGLAPDLALSRRYIAERLERDESIVLLAQSAEGASLGFVQMYPTFASLRAARVLVLYDLFVAPAARRHGVARKPDGGVRRGGARGRRGCAHAADRPDQPRRAASLRVARMAP